MNGSSSEPCSPTLPSKASTKARSLADILDKLGPIANVSYTPFQPEEPSQLARAILPPSFPQDAHPFDYFSLFFTPDLFQTITTNTNRYASIQKLYTKQEFARKWTNMLIEELYVFIGVIIYIGVYSEPTIDLY